ncbi:hypothetical protein T440DRAFT_471055 [Plenodomus tracheiphilus IPT5]|uniref:Uncharacterized protein n=1 Tax=Plenodomus tracheiphilus IPT5 TaxID=1408161 RepID=A0A6A7AVM9_9PLEO|nr:hypothetical protein T440DRAFT_471055 [Plenodomus tracheiphilus IPT5]
MAEEPFDFAGHARAEAQMKRNTPGDFLNPYEDTGDEFVLDPQAQQAWDEAHAEAQAERNPPGDFVEDNEDPEEETVPGHQAKTRLPAVLVSKRAFADAFASDLEAMDKMMDDPDIKDVYECYLCTPFTPCRRCLRLARTLFTSEMEELDIEDAAEYFENNLDNGRDVNSEQDIWQVDDEAGEGSGSGSEPSPSSEREADAGPEVDAGCTPDAARVSTFQDAALGLQEMDCGAEEATPRRVHDTEEPRGFTRKEEAQMIHFYMQRHGITEGWEVMKDPRVLPGRDPTRVYRYFIRHLAAVPRAKQCRCHRDRRIGSQWWENNFERVRSTFDLHGTD